MSRVTKWKPEKTKVKVVFRLQFHATHIPLSGWDKLFISFIPADSGKVTVKTTKANVRNGTCKWGDPIYETTRLLQDLKTKHYDEKLYKLVVAMGTSRSSVLGEATINLSDFAGALKPSVAVLPLHGSDSGTALHVTVQLLTSKTGFREFEQQRELRERGLQTDHYTSDESSGRKVSSSEEAMRDLLHKVNSRVRFSEKSKDPKPLGEEVGPNEECADSAAGFDGSSNTSGSLYAEKQETSSNHEIDSLKSTASGDLAGVSPTQSPQPNKADPSDCQFSAHGTTDWVHGWSSDYSVDNELATVYEENSRLRGSLEAAESSIHELKLEVSSLQSHANEIGREAQQFAKQLAAEILSGEMLIKDVSVLKSECSKLKDDLEQLKVSKVCPPIISREAIGADQVHMLQDIVLRWTKGVLAMEDKIRELQNKTFYGYNEGDLRFLQSDIEALLGILQNLKQGSGLAVSNLNLSSEEGNLKEIREIVSHQNGQRATVTGLDLDVYQPELSIVHCLNIPGLISHEPDAAVDATNVMKGKIFELLRELDESKAERDCIAKKMDQMECYYEALVQELEENQRRILLELQNLRNEHSTCLYTVSSTKAEMESLHQGLNDQILRLAKEKLDLDSLNKEFERRAVTAEAALRRARLNYSIAVEQLQKDLELLSCQILSMHETNENLIKEAFIDPSPESYNGVALGEHATKLPQFQNQSIGTQKQQLGEDIHLDDLKRSLHLQEGLYRKVEQEFCEMHDMNTYLDVLSTVLQETVLDAREDAKVTKQKLDELELQLELSSESKEILMQDLRTAMDEVHSLNASCNEMALRNQNLEANLQTLIQENHLFAQKITEWESLVMQYRGYENRYEACAAENTELTYLLEKKTLEIGILQNNNFSLQDELKAVKIEFDELASGKENLQNVVNFLQHKLQSLLSSYDKISSLLAPLSGSESQNLQTKDLTEVLEKLEELQHNACDKILQLVEENKCVLHERDSVQLNIMAAESEIVLMKKKLEYEIRNIADKLDASNKMMQKMQLDMEALANRFETNEFEERYTQEHTKLFSDLDHLEVQLQEIASKNADLAHDISALETVTATELTVENQALMACLQEKNEESNKLASEMESLRESLQSLHDENRALIACSLDKTEESARLAEELNNLKESMQSLHGENQALMASSRDKAAEAIKHALELSSLKGNLQSMDDENQALKIASREKAEESAKLELEIKVIKESLLSLQNDKEALIIWSQDKVEESAKLTSELNLVKESLESLHVEKEALMSSLQEKDEASAKLAMEINNLKESLQSLHDEKKALVVSSRDKIDEFADLTLELNRMKESLESLHDEKKSLLESAQSKTEEGSKLASEVHRLEESLQTLHEENQVLMACSWEKSNEIDVLQSELNSLREQLQILHSENQALMVSSRDKTGESAQLALELNSLRDSLQSLNDQLHEERSLRESLESKIADQASQLNKKESQLLHLLKSVSRLESENLRVCNLLSTCDKSLEIARKECFSIPGLETDLCEMLELLIATDIRLIFTKTQYEGLAEQMAFQLCSSDRDLAELRKKYSDTETALDSCLASNAHHIEENKKLLINLSSVKSMLEASITENKSVCEANCITKAELDGNRNQDLDVIVYHSEERSQHSLEVESPVLMLLNSEEEIDNLVLSNEELEITVLLLKAKLNEKQAQMIATQGYRDELKKQCNEITQKLAQQTMKTEEFRNLSIHLKELKDKADAECIQAHEKKEPGVSSPLTMQDSLRIAFIKEQYETKLQELKQQLSISKKHSEEMLWKLQDAIDEVESRKKSEACHLKKNEELGIKILDLEAELQLLLTDKREITKAYDLMKAEMECSLISLECCKEERQKLEASLLICSKEKSKIAAELIQMREILEKFKLTVNQNDGSCMDGPLCDEKRSVDVVSTSFSSSNCDEVDQTSILMNVQPKHDHLAANGILSPTKSLHSNMKQSVLLNDHLRAESLMISMDNLRNELERMKNENSLLQDHDLEVKFPNLQSEILQLQKANEDLGSMFPSFNEFSGSGNALERVLALEMELAEALQAKKRSSIHFQSSFLKQHSDEEAVFKSFRDINELIKDMLEIKGRYSSVEKELKEMHDRYSQLSLQFAEVEGERQKLMMTLKNVRASKKALQLNCSPSASLGDHSA